MKILSKLHSTSDIKITVFSDEIPNIVKKYISSKQDLLYYYMTEYHNLLSKTLDSTLYYFCAMSNGKIVGIIPALLKVSDTKKSIMNSLPFFGSFGGPIADSDDIKTSLEEYYFTYCREVGCASATIVHSPLISSKSITDCNKSDNFLWETRLCQITDLRRNVADFEDFHNSRRRNVLKASKNKIEVFISHEIGVMQSLCNIHRENLNNMNGVSKDWKFFKGVVNNVSKDNYRIYAAAIHGRIIAGLLLFYCHNTVEYFTPAIDSSYRSLQPLSLLIHTAMCDAKNQDFTRWNWGGTWESQKSLYQFKRRWGAEDYLYNYQIRIFDDSILHLSRAELQNSFPYFYVCPFDLLVDSKGK